MHLRGNKKWKDENTPDPNGQPAPEPIGKTTRARRGKASVPARAGAATPGQGRQSVLREKTNIECQGRAVGRKSSGVSGRGSCGVTPRTRGRASPKGGEKEERGGAGRKCCVYMNAASELSVASVSEKNVYEFEVDGNEPPSRRRRRRAPPNAKNKRRVFPRLPRVRFPSRSETTASSVESGITLSSSGWGLVAMERVMPELEPPVVTSCSKAACTSTTVGGPELDLKQRKRLSTVLESPPNASVTTSPAEAPTSEAVGVDNCGDSELKTSQSTVTCSVTTPSKVPRTENLATTHPVHEEPFLGNSVLSNANSSFFLGCANHHSTPIKARSGSDSSSNFTHSVVDATAEKCFGFSSDEEEEEGGLPSPLPTSPHTRALRHTLLTSSPKQQAPSRFAPEVVRRALVLEAVSRPLHFEGARPRRQQCASNPVAGDVKKKRRPREKKKALGEGGQQGIDEYLLKRRGVEEPVDGGGRVEEGAAKTPPTGSLFAEPREEGPGDEEPVVSVSVRPPRRSYERPWNRKLKKVIGGGLCLDSSEEEEDEVKQREEPEEVAPLPRAPKPHAPKAAARHRTKAENKENQMDQWASQINSQFDEVEDFELCLA